MDAGTCIKRVDKKIYRKQYLETYHHIIIDFWINSHTQYLVYRTFNINNTSYKRNVRRDSLCYDFHKKQKHIRCNSCTRFNRLDFTFYCKLLYRCKFCFEHKHQFRTGIDYDCRRIFATGFNINSFVKEL